MQTELAIDAPAPPTREGVLLRLLFISDVCAVREALAAILERDRSIGVVKCGDPVEIAALDLTAQVDAVLVHTSMRDGIDVARRLRGAAPHLPIVAFPLRETQEEVIAWAEAGATGYISVSVRLGEFAGILKRVLGGEQICSPRVAAGLLRRVTATNVVARANPRLTQPLTRRERQVSDLLAARLDDKEIAQHLNIGLATAKSHVHNLLRKLNVRRRRDVVEALRGQPPGWLV
jgi:two-component system nitrate/nitrite response regulator NarL